MARGEFRIADQIGSKGYYGQVTLETETTEVGGDVAISFDPPSTSRWMNGARFGIDYVLDHIPKRKYFPSGGKVHVLCIEGHEVDTNNVVIAYVAARALCRALGVELTKQPTFDAASGTFNFPK